MPPLDAAPIDLYSPQRVLNTQWSQVTSYFDQAIWSGSANKKLNKISRLSENWNSYGSPPVSDKVIEIGRTLLREFAKMLMPEPKIVPVSGGGIQFEWSNPKSDLEIEVLPDLTLEYLLVDENRNIIEGIIEQSNFAAQVLPLTFGFEKEVSSNLTV